MVSPRFRVSCVHSQNSSAGSVPHQWDEEEAIKHITCSPTFQTVPLTLVEVIKVRESNSPIVGKALTSSDEEVAAITQSLLPYSSPCTAPLSNTETRHSPLGDNPACLQPKMLCFQTCQTHPIPLKSLFSILVFFFQLSYMNQS